MSELIDKVNKVLCEALEERYIDDAFYLQGEWRLTGLWHNSSVDCFISSVECYFASVEVDTPDPKYRTSLYRIDVEDGEIQEDEFALWAGNSSAALPPGSQEISLI